MPIFGAAYAAPNIDTNFILIKFSIVLSPTENSRIQELFKSDFPVLFKEGLISRIFQESPLKSSAFD